MLNYSFQQYSGLSTTEFSLRWDHWQGECRARLERGEFINAKQLENICQVINILLTK